MFAVDGLFQVGFARWRDLLLVHSPQGRGLFDVVSGTRLARDDEEPMDEFDRVQLTASGFADLAGDVVGMAGLFGGGLHLTTLDGFGLEMQAPCWPRRDVMLVAPDRSRNLAGDDGACTLRAFGFSPTGRSFVIATSCELQTFARAAG